MVVTRNAVLWRRRLHNFSPRVLRILLRKLIQGLMMVLIVSAATFALLATVGGDAFSSLSENPQVSQAAIENLRRVYGLDRPLAVRYASWIGGAVRGDLGESFYFRVPVAGLISSRFLNTLVLAGAAMLIAVALATVLAFLSARWRSRSLDRMIGGLVLLAASTPRMVLALFALALATRFAVSTAGDTGAFAGLLPAATVMAAPFVSLFLAQARDGLGEAMNEEFVQLARAKGLGESSVIARHASRAALNPLLTIFGLSLGGLLGGSVIVETVLGRPGLGSLMVTAVRGRDLPLVMGIVLVTSTAVWVANAVAEILQAVNDKRLRDAG